MNPLGRRMVHATPDSRTEPGPLAGNLVLLRRTGVRAQGRFLARRGTFMAMRRPGEGYPARPRHPVDPNPASRRTAVAPSSRPWEHPVPWTLSR